MSTTTFVELQDPSSKNARHLLRLVGETRHIELRPSCDDGENSLHECVNPPIPAKNILLQLQAVSSILSAISRPIEAEVLQEVYQLGTSSTDLGGLGIDDAENISDDVESEILFLASAHLESLNAGERAKVPVQPLKTRPEGRRGMTMAEKIFAAHDIDRKGEVKPGDVIRVNVDWVLASELSWAGMEKVYNQLGKPGIFRNDRFWLAGDHVVDPRIMDHPKIKHLVAASQRAKYELKMTQNQGMNYTIMHTEFCRERAQPGMLVIGSDSHTCSAGSVSALAIGLGVADVILPLITGETWFRVPETVNIRLVNKPPPGIGGKDVILYILKELKRNTVASERVVEYTGPGVKYLSCDARFAIANMTTEFGGVSGIFEADSVTQEYIQNRKNSKHKSDSRFFRADEDAQYAATHVIDLAKVESFVARYPKPDDVVPVTEMLGMKLQGCFIGACTTAEEDIVLAALVLQEGLRRGMRPQKGGKRKIVPGSRPILKNLRKFGLVDVYERAGFEIGVPGCSYCVGMSADKAEAGETWLSSQNRNFENRMGPGAFGNLSSAVTVAASSFNMEITCPKSLLDGIDLDLFNKVLGYDEQKGDLPEPDYVEPGVQTSPCFHNEGKFEEKPKSNIKADGTTASPNAIDSPHSANTTLEQSLIRGKVSLLGDFIDTDALAPNEALIIPGITREQLGDYCLYHTYPDFRRNARELGHNIVVAGEAFGCGSSRENAVTALQGVGVQCVIAKSFAFIYGRNQPNLGMLGIEMRNERFWEVIAEGKSVAIDLDKCVVEVEVEENAWESFLFQLSPLQRRLYECGGAVKAFGKWGADLWAALCSSNGSSGPNTSSQPVATLSMLEPDKERKKMEW